MTRLFVGLCIVATVLVSTAKRSVRTTSARNDRDTVQAVAFLEFLKSGQRPAPRTAGFNPENGGHWSVDTLLQFLDARGVTFYDVNGDTTWSKSISVLRSELTKRTGPSFVMLVHLGHIYSQPYPQYSHLTFSRAADTLKVSLADWYQVIFVRRSGGVRVTRIEYLEEEVE